jgi:histone acetyltransferase (RNA polymerase elongator complex component)
MKPLIIPIFINQKGCSNRCIFCNQRLQSGLGPDILDEDNIRGIIIKYLNTSKGKTYSRREIAFFGGSFTAIDRSIQEFLLRICSEFIENGEIDSIRVSTRPDAVSKATSKFLRMKGVATVEVGAESMIDDVLRISRRGHLSSHTVEAVSALKGEGIQVGLHLMVGLPGDSLDGWKITCQEVISLRPDMVRIHPTLVLKDTELAELWSQGKYNPLPLGEAIKAVKWGYLKFIKEGISVIRIGLQPTPLLEEEGTILAGPYHPAFRQLVESSIFLDMVRALFEKCNPREEEIFLRVYPGDESALRGQGNANILTLCEIYPGKKWKVIRDSNVNRLSLTLETKGVKDSISVSDLY